MCLGRHTAADLVVVVAHDDLPRRDVRCPYDPTRMPCFEVVPEEAEVASRAGADLLEDHDGWEAEVYEVSHVTEP